MVFIMTATPLAMKFCGFGIGETANVLSVHILGMFAPSFVTGHIIRRIGERRVLLAGAAAMIATVAIGLAGIDILHFWFALVLLGIGWNFLFVGGTSLLTKCYRPAERAKMQGMNDFLTFTGVALCSFIAGAVEQSWGWNAVLLGSLVPTVADPRAPSPGARRARAWPSRPRPSGSGPGCTLRPFSLCSAPESLPGLGFSLDSMALASQDDTSDRG